MTNKRLALVVIGRNEAQNLQRALPAVQGIFSQIIYVDSGSSDGSQDIARQHNASVIDLDTHIPFTAARARNAGFKTLQSDSAIEYVQFIDGDCELIPEYLDKAIDFLDAHSDFAIVCGRRRERYPERSVFNTLCNLEWNTPVGETKYCGGDVMVRLTALRQIQGYNAELIAGEDPEICVRLRQAGWKIYRIEADMTWHDANITRISQWWKRHQRTGHAFAEGADLHGNPPECHWVRETRSNWFWGGLFMLSLLGGLLISPVLWLLLIIFPLQAIRIAIKAPRIVKRQPKAIRLLYGLDCAFSKIPEFIGQLRFVVGKYRKKRQTLIEYK